MIRAAFSAAFADMCAAIAAIQLYYTLNLQPGAGATTTTASAAPVGDYEIFLTLVAAGALYAAVALVYRRLRQAEAAADAGAGAGGGDRALSDLVAFVSAAAGVLEIFLFAHDVGALGLAAARFLPTASIATFFLGMVLIILVHIRAGGEGGGGAVVGDGHINPPEWLITKVAFAAAAGLVSLMAIALCAAKY